MKSDDRRVRKTKKALATALAELMLDKKLERITVRELCDKADVHRATFYSHYSDVFDLYEKIESHIISDIEVLMHSEECCDYSDIIRNLTEFVYSNPKIFILVINSGKSQSFYDKILEILVKGYFEIWVHEIGAFEITEKCLYLAKYHLQGCIKLLELWIEKGFVLSKDEIQKLIFDVDSNFDVIMENYIVKTAD